MAARARRPGREAGGPPDETPDQRRKRLAADRQARKRARDKAHVPTMPDREISELIDKQKTAIVQRVMAEEIRPIVREAIDQDAVEAIKGMVGLAPAAILVLGNLLNSTDEITRARAAQTVVKYTMGNSLVTPPRADQGEKLLIINQLPDGFRGEPIPVEAESFEDDECVKTCDTCKLTKPCAQFPGDGPRCAKCLSERKESVVSAFLNQEDRALLSENAVRIESSAADVQRPSGAGGSEVHQTGAGLQRKDVRPSGLVENRQADPSGYEGGGPKAWEARVRPTASETFSGPVDPRRWSTGR